MTRCGRNPPPNPCWCFRHSPRTAGERRKTIPGHPPSVSPTALIGCRRAPLKIAAVYDICAARIVLLNVVNNVRVAGWLLNVQYQKSLVSPCPLFKKGFPGCAQHARIHFIGELNYITLGQREFAKQLCSVSGVNVSQSYLLRQRAVPESAGRRNQQRSVPRRIQSVYIGFHTRT